MNKDQLIQLREKILNDVTPLVIENAQDGLDRFELLIRVIRAGNSSSELYSRTYESAKSIENVSDRLEALLTLLDEVDFCVDNIIQKNDDISLDSNNESVNNNQN